MGGVELELIGSDGAAIARTRSEYDGYFLFEKVVYGKYGLRVSADSEKAIGAQGELAANIELTGQKTTAKVGTVKLRAPTTVAVAASP